MRQTSSLWNPLLSLWAPVFAGCGETLLAGGPSRRYLRKSFPRCLVPYPGASPGAPTRYFPGDIGLYQLGNGSATRTLAVRRLLYGGPSRGCRHSLMFRPLGLLATQVAPTAGPHRDSGQPWLLRPSISRLVTLPCLGYASRPNRAMDGVGTHTPLDLRPCRPLPQAALALVYAREYRRSSAAAVDRSLPSTYFLREGRSANPTEIGEGYVVCACGSAQKSETRVIEASPHHYRTSRGYAPASSPAKHGARGWRACRLHPSILQPLVGPGQPYCPQTSCLMAQVERPSCQARY
jgi:hypothetical protein